jgi:U3 small nucleolar RNA-associated protein 10
VAESATFVAECAEDENDAVVEEALKLRDAMEAVAGSISQL